MTDALIPSKRELERKLGSLQGPRSLRDLVKKADAEGAMLLLDCSGSMGEVIATGERKIEALRAVVADVRKNVNVPMIAFGPFPGVVDVTDQVPEPQGGTPMAQAIEHAHNGKKVHLIVISDGVPDSTQMTLDQAKKFMDDGGKRIDAIYIGNDGDYGAKFMADLAAVGGGSQSVTDLVEQKLLAQTIKGLLGDGGGSNGPIQL
jgi:hypothetical protein